MQLVATRQIGAPAERVWALCTDLEVSPRVMSGIDSVDRLCGPEGFAVGTGRLETQAMFGFGASSTTLVRCALGATIAPLLVGATRQPLEQDLADLAAAAEQHAG